MTIPIVRTRAALGEALQSWRAAGRRIGLVPTMGALHEGHLALVRMAGARCDRVVVSIFVNPAQFAPHEDFAGYPREEAADVAKAGAVGCDLVWAPELAAMYPEGFATRIVPGGAAEGLESDFRPHFFAGVATVCCKLFGQVRPAVAVFGEKDYQQLEVVRQMVRDLDLGLDIVAHPTVREPDGLAMSSRNAYLSPAERRAAPELHRAIARAARELAEGAAAGAALGRARAALAACGFRIDYVEARDAGTLRPPEEGSRGALRILAAAWLGRTRLIDNVPVPPRE